MTHASGCIARDGRRNTGLNTSSLSLDRHLQGYRSVSFALSDIAGLLRPRPNHDTDDEVAHYLCHPLDKVQMTGANAKS
jgi:hypothetical protein